MIYQNSQERQGDLGNNRECKESGEIRCHVRQNTAAVFEEPRENIAAVDGLVDRSSGEKRERAAVFCYQSKRADNA